MSVDVSEVLDDISTALDTISGLRVMPPVPKSAQPPFAFCGFPVVDYDLTARRGMDRMTVTVYVGVADQVDRAAWDAINEYAAGSGAKSIKAVLEAAGIGTSLRVQRVEFGQITLASGTYTGATFTVDVQA